MDEPYVLCAAIQVKSQRASTHNEARDCDPNVTVQSTERSDSSQRRCKWADQESKQEGSNIGDTKGDVNFPSSVRV